MKARAESLASLLPSYLDQNAAAWAAVLPGVAVDTGPLFGRLEALSRWIRWFHESTLAPYRITYAEYVTLATLRVSDPELRGSPTELRRLVGQTSAGMTNTLSKLETAGLVRREPHPDDARRVDVVLTEAGRELAEQTFRSFREAQASLLAPLAKADRRALTEGLDGLLAAFLQDYEGNQTEPTGETAAPRPKQPTKPGGKQHG